MQVTGAVIREQGVTFAVVVVKSHVVSNSHEARDTIAGLTSVFRCRLCSWPRSQNHDLAVRQPVHQHGLKIVPRPYAVGIEEDIKARFLQAVVKLQGRSPGIVAPITDEDAALLAKETEPDVRSRRVRSVPVAGSLRPPLLPRPSARRSPKNRGPFHAVPVMARAIVERLV
jgi:hypothetical protein